MQEEQEQIISQQSEEYEQLTEPLKISNPDQSSKRKSLYSCTYCQCAHHSKKWVKNSHLKTCKIRKSIKQSNASRKARQIIAKNRLQQQEVLFNQNQNAIVQIEQNDQMKKRLTIVQQKLLKLSDVQHVESKNRSKLAQLFTEQVFAQIGTSILNNLKIQFQSSAERAIMAGLQVYPQKSLIMLNCLHKINQVEFNEVFFDFSQKLKRAHDQLQSKTKRKFGQDVRTLDNNQKCYSYLSGYSQFHFQYQNVIINDLLKEGNHKKRQIPRYFNLIRKIDPFFARFPALPKYQQKIKKFRPLIEINQIVGQVADLYQKGKLQLSADVWFCACLGFRATELLRACIKGPHSNQYAKCLKIQQRKNLHISVRFIPNSLVILSELCKVSYPMTSSRFKAARTYCLQVFRSFYALRHTAITSILSAIAQQNVFGKFHKNIRTTKKFYVNENDQRLIDNIFQLPLGKNVPNIPSRDIMIDLTGSKMKEISIKEKNLEITIDRIQELNQQQNIDQSLSSTSNYRLAGSDSLKKIEKLKIQSQIYCFQKFESELQKQYKNTIEESISSTLYDINDHEDFSSMISNQIADRGQYTDSYSIIAQSSRHLKTNIVYYELNEESDPQIVKFSPGQSSQKTLIISKVGDLYSSSQDEKLQIDESKRQKMDQALQTIQRQTSQSLIISFTNLKPKCIFKKKCGKVFYGKLNGKLVLQCQKCLQSVTSDPRKLNLRTNRFNQVRFLQKKPIHQDHKSLQKTKKKNNLGEQIRKQFGSSAFSKFCLYSDSIPMNIITNYCEFSQQLQKEILYNKDNEQFLPLEIKNSPIAGKGMFATTDLQPNRIVITYVGVVAVLNQVDISNDSLFFVGWLNTAIPKQVVIWPHIKLNSARYANSSDKMNQANCRLYNGFVKDQLVVYLCSLRKIKKGQEILYTYGKKYNLSQKHSEEQIQEEVSQNSLLADDQAI